MQEPESSVTRGGGLFLPTTSAHTLLAHMVLDPLLLALVVFFLQTTSAHTLLACVVVIFLLALCSGGGCGGGGNIP